MFFLIPIIGSIISSVSTASVASAAVASAAVASVSTASAVTAASSVAACTAVAVGLKKIADEVEEENRAAVAQAKRSSFETISKCQAEAEAKKTAYKEKKIDSLSEQVLKSDMSEKDKEACLKYIKK